MLYINLLMFESAYRYVVALLVFIVTHLLSCHILIFLEFIMNCFSFYTALWNRYFPDLALTHLLVWLRTFVSTARGTIG